MNTLLVVVDRREIPDGSALLPMDEVVLQTAVPNSGLTEELSDSAVSTTDGDLFYNISVACLPPVDVNTSAECYNGTSTEASGSQPSWMVFVGLILAVIILSAVIGNGLVVTAVTCFRRLRSVTNYFVVSLAVADIAVAVLVMPYSLLYEVYGEWRFGWAFCYFWISCDVTCCTASILNLCVISLDRYLAIMSPLSYKSMMSRSRAFSAICLVWLCSSAISFVPIYMGWFADTAIVNLYVDGPVCALHVNKVYAVLSSTTSFYIPLLVMVVVYSKIYKIASKQAKDIERLERSVQNYPAVENKVRLARRSKKFNKDFKALKTLGTLMGVFCVSWLPFFLMYIIMPFCSTCSVPPTVGAAITWLGYANSCINPCVYAYLNRDFRMAFRKLLLCSREKKRFGFCSRPETLQHSYTNEGCMSSATHGYALRDM